jgi:hypothetical protein
MARLKPDNRRTESQRFGLCLARKAKQVPRRPMWPDAVQRQNKRFKCKLIVGAH